MRVVIVGCGRFGAELATRLFQGGHDVSIIDPDEAAFARLPNNFEGRINQGDALDLDVLHRAGIENADAVAVVTDSDILNATVGHVARTYYNKTNVVLRNHDPRYRPILEAYGLQMVSALSWGAQRLEEMIYHGDARPVFSAGNGEVEIYEVPVPAEWSGRSLGELVTTESSIPVSLTRAGRAMLPSAEMIVEEGDIIHVSATLQGVDALRSRRLMQK
jgi:trk system potassium uptake protein TrkA